MFALGSLGRAQHFFEPEPKPFPLEHQLGHLALSARRNDQRPPVLVQALQHPRHLGERFGVGVGLLHLTVMEVSGDLGAKVGRRLGVELGELGLERHARGRKVVDPALLGRGSERFVEDVAG
ncbi:MAG TPA: hypothetical protein VEY07_00630 [Thermoplasmata archaeon]|nr:hypothetical protein [Thermoplasmata archaeon]